MQDFIESLDKRHSIAIYVIAFFAVVASMVDSVYTVMPFTYFEGKYNLYAICFLFVYKVIELAILYYLLMYRYLDKIEEDNLDDEYAKKIYKHIKLLFFLIPQGNIIFGLLAYKLSGDIIYFLTFLLIALITLYLTQIKKYNICSLSTQA